jgi:hypothetical protein
MSANNSPAAYRIWGVDNVVYGPVDLPILTNWTEEERVTPDTWIHLEHENAWHKAAELPELRALLSRPFTSGGTEILAAARRAPIAEIGLKPATLRRAKILASMDDRQLERFKAYLTHYPVLQWTVIVKQGDPGDAMYLVLEGEVRVRIKVGERESIIATLPAGEFFGELCLFDYGPRSADVVANVASELLAISASSFQRLVTHEPDLAALFLTAIGKTLAARMRADNKRFTDFITFARAN